MLVDAAGESRHFRIGYVPPRSTTSCARTAGSWASATPTGRPAPPTSCARSSSSVATAATPGVREALALPRRDLAAPFDCLYVRLPMHDGDPDRKVIRFSARGGVIMLNRNTYWQVASDRQGRPDAVEVGAAQHPRPRAVLADRVDDVTAADVASLEVRQDRVRRWWAPGALCIGDAAHAMTPIAGMGINLAIQDAVAAARILVPRLRAGSVSDRALAAVQRRRVLPTVLTQALQRVTQRRAIVTRPGPGPGAASARGSPAAADLAARTRVPDRHAESNRTPGALTWEHDYHDD